jgi:outer membrane biosynthesis protein TonB
MTDNFESQKNIKASGYTLLICTLLVILFIYLSWTQPAQPPPVVEDGIEVNLGNSDQGMGTDQPYLPGKPAARDEQKYTAPSKAVVAKEPEKDVETDDKQTEDAPVIKKPAITKPDATKIPDKEVVKARPVKVVKTEAPPAPVKPRPKALFRGTSGNGNGGNDADDYKAGGSEGVAGGHGDQGQPGGDPNSKSYSGGGSGNSGVTISRGLKGRNILVPPVFTDDFNQNAKVAVDIHVDANGNVEDADYQPRGSTTADGTLKAIARRKAKQVKFNATGEESVGTIVFNFKIKN